MQYICEVCRGTGYVKDKDDHLDICEKCWGLGYYEKEREIERPKREITPEEKKIRMNGFILMCLIIGSTYGSIIAISQFVKFSIYELFPMMLGSYIIGLAGNSIYIRRKLKRLKRKQELQNVHGN